MLSPIVFLIIPKYLCAYVSLVVSLVHNCFPRHTYVPMCICLSSSFCCPHCFSHHTYLRTYLGSSGGGWWLLGYRFLRKNLIRGRAREDLAEKQNDILTRSEIEKVIKIMRIRQQQGCNQVNHVFLKEIIGQYAHIWCKPIWAWSTKKCAISGFFFIYFRTF